MKISPTTTGNIGTEGARSLAAALDENATLSLT
jgi:hypothetical protein